MGFFSRYSGSWRCSMALVALFSSNQGFTQVYPYINYSVRQGLVNSNVYAIAQDHTGYIWLGTENGLSRFDGITFQNYTLKHLQLKSYISSLAVMDDGQIVFASGSSGIFRFDPVNDQLTRLTKKVILRSNQIIIKDDLLVSLHENRGFDFVSLKSGEMSFIDSVFVKNTDIKAFSMLMLKDGTILMGRSDGLYQLDGMHQRKVIVPGLGNNPVYSIYEDKNCVLLGGDGIIYRIENNTVIDTIRIFSEGNKMIRNIKIDSRGNLWFNVWGLKEIYMITGNNMVNITEKAGLINGTITGIFNEASGTIWVTGIGKGIFLFNNNHLLVYPESESFPNANIQKIVKTPKGGLLLGTDNGLAYLDPTGKKINSFKHIPGIRHYVKEITGAPGDQYLVATIDHKFAYPFSGLFDCPYENFNIRYSHCSSIWTDSSNILIGNWDNKLIQYRLPSLRYVKSEENVFYSTNNTHRINCILNDEYNHLWIGSQKGLCIIDQQGKKYYPNGMFQEEEVYKITRMPNGNLLVVSNSGFYLIKNNPGINEILVLRRTAIQGINCIAITGEDEYLAGTSYGLLFVKGGKQLLMTIQDGLLSENINDIFYDNSNSVAWVATSEGLMQVDMKVLRKENSAPLDIRQVLIVQNDKHWIPEVINNFNYKSNSFSIKLQSFHYQNPQKIKYHYKVDDGVWLQAPSNEIQFASMTHGNHRILLRMSLSESDWGPVKIVNISVTPPFYKTWWFYMLIITAVSLLIAVVVNQQVRIFKKNQHEKVITQQKMVELQQKALASNLNPHFVFNSLNAIQHFINSKSPSEANDYLAKFARLMRMQLNMAEKSYILLHEEIQRLEYYLSLEQMRFGDRMNWSVSIDETIDPYHTEIPNMIIQPFVENAIWHGIMPSINKGAVSLEIKPDSPEGIEIIVTDNGVGFGNQPTKGKSGHESKGTRLIRERLLLLDPYAHDVLAFEPLMPGTRVRIKLTPKMIRKTNEAITVS